MSTSTPPARFVLDRIAVEQDRLKTATAMLDKVVPDVSRFGKQTKNRLAASLKSVRKEWDQLGRRIVDEDGVSTHLLERFGTLNTATDGVVRETSALANGVLARERSLDGGACAQADLLIAELSVDVDPNLVRATIPGDTEFLHRGSDLIRRRLPDHGLWDLPVMGHEFGHVIVQHRTWKPKEDQMVEVGSRVVTGWPDCSEGLGEEHFCDVFATYALGPSYAATMLLHRLNPHASTTNGDTHPADPRRAAVVLTALGQLSKDEPAYSRYTEMCGSLEHAWRALQVSAPDSAKVDDALQGQLRVQTLDVLAVLDADLSSARYVWPATVVRDVAEALEQDANPEGHMTYRIRDVLAAAWMLRLEAIIAGAVVAPHVMKRAALLVKNAEPSPAKIRRSADAG